MSFFFCRMCEKFLFRAKTVLIDRVSLQLSIILSYLGFLVKIETYCNHIIKFCASDRGWLGDWSANIRWLKKSANGDDEVRTPKMFMQFKNTTRLRVTRFFRLIRVLCLSPGEPFWTIWVIWALRLIFVYQLTSNYKIFMSVLTTQVPSIFSFWQKA